MNTLQVFSQNTLLTSFELWPGTYYLCRDKDKLQLSRTLAPGLLARIFEERGIWQVEVQIKQDGQTPTKNNFVSLLEDKPCHLLDLELRLKIDQESAEFDRTTVITDLAEVARTLGATTKNSDGPSKLPDHMKATTITDLSDIQLALSKRPKPKAYLEHVTEDLSYPITSTIFKIGKQSGCDLILSGLLAPALAATIKQRTDGFYLNPSAKVRVNGQPSLESQPLKDGDHLEVGKLKLRFREAD